MRLKNCRWVVKTATPETPAEYCSNKCKYNMILADDGSGTRIRVDHTFCPKHEQQIKDEQEMHADPLGGDQ